MAAVPSAVTGAAGSGVCSLAVGCSGGTGAVTRPDDASSAGVRPEETAWARCHVSSHRLCPCASCTTDVQESASAANVSLQQGQTFYTASGSGIALSEQTLQDGNPVWCYTRLPPNLFLIRTSKFSATTELHSFCRLATVRVCGVCAVLRAARLPGRRENPLSRHHKQDVLQGLRHHFRQLLALCARAVLAHQAHKMSGSVAASTAPEHLSCNC